IDFGVLIEPANISKYDFIKLPTTDTWGLLMRKDNALASIDKITPDIIKNRPLICSNQEMVRNEISGWLGKDFNTLNIVATYNLIYNAALLVEENVGYALTLDKLVNTECNSHLCFRPLEPKLEVGLTIVWKRYQVFSKASQLFIEELQKKFSSVG
ncbi:MAG: LysR family transcriptional regulator substrate-binding protein, partial [Coprobacillus sp.]